MEECRRDGWVRAIWKLSLIHICPWVLKIADAAHASLEFDQLSIAQIRRGFSILNGQGDMGARSRRQLEQELIATFIEGGRRNDAAVQNHVFARAGVDFGGKSGTVQRLEQRPAKQHQQRCV